MLQLDRIIKNCQCIDCDGFLRQNHVCPQSNFTVIAMNSKDCNLITGIDEENYSFTICDICYEYKIEGLHQWCDVCNEIIVSDNFPVVGEGKILNKNSFITCYLCKIERK